MKLRVRPSTIEGEVSSSPSKSYTHRAMALALLAEGTSHLRRPLLSGDTLATLSAVRKFGAEADREGEVLHIDGGRLRCPDDVINVDNSGTTIRIMAGIASLLPCITVLTGDESIRRRPMQPLIDALGELGAECRSTRGNGLAPLLVRGPNTGTRTHIKGDVSSQFISSLLISSAVKTVDTEIVLTTPLALPTLCGDHHGHDGPVRGPERGASRRLHGPGWPAIYPSGLRRPGGLLLRRIPLDGRGTGRPCQGAPPRPAGPAGGQGGAGHT